MYLGKIFLSIFYWLCYYSFPNFSPFIHPPPSTHLHPPAFLPLSSCPWVVHTSSLDYLFSIPFLTSLCLFYAYQLCFFFPLPFPLYPSPPPSHWKPSMWCTFLWLCSCSSCLLSVCFSFFLDSFVNNCEFVVILLFIVFDLLQFLR